MSESIAFKSPTVVEVDRPLTVMDLLETFTMTWKCSSGDPPLGLAAADGRPLAEDTGLVSRWWRCAAGHEARGGAEGSPSACELHAEVSWALVAGISRVLL